MEVILGFPSVLGILKALISFMAARDYFSQVIFPFSLTHNALLTHNNIEVIHICGVQCGVSYM